MPLLKYFADDPDYHGVLDHLLGRVVRNLCPENLFLVRIDNWFDWKWLGFAGTVPLDTIRLLGPAILPTATRGVWNSGEKTTVPPFTPSRIVRQDHYLCAGGAIGRPSEPISIHPMHRRRNEPETETRILDICQDGWFFWLSSDSAQTGRGSLLAYRAKEGTVTGWYASLERTRAERWVISRSRNMNRETLAFFVDEYYAAQDAR